MNKADILKEFHQQANSMAQKSGGDSTIDLSKVKPQDTSKVVNIVQQSTNLKKQIGDLKKNQAVQNEEETAVSTDKEAFYREMIDNLLDARYGLTYFEQRDGIPCYQTMSDDDKQRMSFRYSGYGYPAIIAQIGRGELHNAYMSLQNILQRKNENLVSNKLFSIIAENEAPSISKQDFIEYVNKKRT